MFTEKSRHMEEPVETKKNDSPEAKLKSKKTTSKPVLDFFKTIGEYIWMGVLGIGAFLAWLISFLLI
ncbi:hypothetical protein RBU60_00855 [Mesonia sp. MT50]|uniref:Uncharacterized protein n=1 Tax=Mesonia profundi TaxID=3070998 RepID=A0ABU0ZXB7_9FLAO|nr:hypothetical protein [Mesonia profundi]MDQ7916112.1 hypothetical protein [Mesonia profundi]